jgi:hypothetical protein
VNARRIRTHQFGRGALVAVSACLVLAVSIGLAVHLATPTSALDASTSAQERAASADAFSACGSCHPDYQTRPPATPGLIFNHQTHLARGAACPACHATAVGHAGAPAPAMSSCFACHEGRKASADCTYCHSNLNEIAPGIGEPSVHVATDPKKKETCAACHDVETFCIDCHGLDIPHPADWLATHGTLGLDRSSLCVKCHQSRDAQFCVRCHGMEMPHPQYWISTHKETAGRDPASCNLCHKDPVAFCDRCHQARGASGSGG